MTDKVDLEQYRFGGWQFNESKRAIVYSRDNIPFYSIAVEDLKHSEAVDYWEDRFLHSAVFDEMGYYGWKDILDFVTLNIIN
jgi:hypothetical protein